VLLKLSKEDFKNLKPVNFIGLTFAGIINAFGVTSFLMPLNIYDSGISGTAMLLAKVTPEYLSLSLFLLVLNIPLFIFGYKKQGFNFTVYSLYAVIIYSLGTLIFSKILPENFSYFAGDDLLLCSLFGGIISGIGSGLTIRFSGAIDGIDVMSVIYAKRLGITVGTFVMVYNVILYIICGLVLKNWILPLYSIVTYMAALKTIDFIVEGLDRAKSVMIVTDKEEEICRKLSDEFKQGITILNAKGYYSSASKKMVYIVLNRFQIAKMRDIVHMVDPKAYISITDVADVYKANESIDV